MTKTGICLNDLYILSYFGFKVIFQVCWTSDDSVRLIELAVKRYKDGWTLTKRYHASAEPLIIKKDNVYTRSTYEVRATREDKKLPIRVDYSSKLFWKACDVLGHPVLVGTLLAVPYDRHKETYWTEPKKKVRDNSEKIIVS